MADGELFELERRKREAGRGGGKVGSIGSISGAAAAFESAAQANKGKKRPADAADDAAAKKSKGPSGVASAVSTEWDVSKMPGSELLSGQEKLLCTTLQLLPQHYLMIKERLIRECFTRGFLKESSAKQLIKIDVNKTSKIFDFFVSVGWLNTGDVIKAQQTTTNGPTTTTTTAAKKPAATTGQAATRPNGPPPQATVKMQQ